MAQDREYQPGKTPVSAHPAFPAIVALWFAALLGLGTIVMPAVVLERIATATGLASILPPAEPPLTLAGRALFALLATVLGLIGGLVLARRVAQAQDTVPTTRRRTATGRSVPPRPLSVHDDLGEDAIAAPADLPTARRRRALAITDDAWASDVPMAAPLPGETVVPELPSELPPVLPEDAMSERPSEFESPAHADEFNLGGIAPPPHDAPAEAQVFEASAAPLEVPAYVPELDTRKPRPIVAPSKSETGMPVPVAAAPIVTAPIDGPLDDLGMVQLAERLGRSLQQRLDAREAEAEAQSESEPLTFAAPSFDHQDDAVAVPPPVVPDALRAFMDVAPEGLAPPPVAESTAEAEVQIPPPVVPSALMPFAFEPFGTDEDDEEIDSQAFSMPVLPRAPLPEAVDVEDPAEDEDDALADENYSSLLEMTNPFRARDEFAGIDEAEAEAEAEAVEEPVEEGAPPAPPRPFDAPLQHQPVPTAAPVRPRPVRDAAETERALRSALANLQRMSGAA